MRMDFRVDFEPSFKKKIFNLMIIKIKSMVILFTIVIGIISCEKPTINFQESKLNSIQENSESLSAQEAIAEFSEEYLDEPEQNEFPEEYWNDLQQFIHNIMEEGEMTDMDIDKALYYTESATDWRFVHSESDPFEFRRRGEDLSFTVYFEIIDDVNIISASNLETLNSDIYDAISNEAETRAQNEEITVLVDDIDLSWEINQAENLAFVTASVIYGYLSSNPPSPNVCSSPWYDCKAVTREKCPSNTPYNNQAEEVDRYLDQFCCYNSSPAGCQWDRKLVCNLSHNMLVNHNTQTLRPVNQPFSFLFPGINSGATGTGPGTCRTVWDHQNYLISIHANWQYQNGVTQMDRLKEVALYVGPTITPQHWVSYRTVVCQPVCNDPFAGCPAIARPEPYFKP